MCVSWWSSSVYTYFGLLKFNGIYPDGTTEIWIGLSEIVPNPFAWIDNAPVTYMKNHIVILPSFSMKGGALFAQAKRPSYDFAILS